MRINGSIFFGAVDHVQGDAPDGSTADTRSEAPADRDDRGINFIDVAGAEMLVQEAKRRRSLGGGLYLYRVQTGVQEALQQGPYLEEIGEENLFPTKSHPIDSIYPRLDSEICRTCTARIFPQCHVALPNGEPRTDEAHGSPTGHRTADDRPEGRTPS